jgi:magnesium chelatase subunit D
MFDIDSTPMDPDLINFSSRERSGKGGGRGLIFSQDRGRYIKPQLPKGKVVRLAVDATLRAAAPYQKARRERSKGTDKEGRGVFIEGGDTRIKKVRMDEVVVGRRLNIPRCHTITR